MYTNFIKQTQLCRTWPVLFLFSALFCWVRQYFCQGSDRPWDAVNDVYQYEQGFVVQTQTRHKTPHLRANSLSSLNKNVEKKKLRIPRAVEESDSSGHGLHRESDSSDYVGKCPAPQAGPSVLRATSLSPGRPFWLWKVRPV